MLLTREDMRAEFARFHAPARRALVPQLYAACGNPDRASALADRAFRLAWAQWRTVREHPDPQAWVRARAWRSMARRPRPPQAVWPGVLAADSLTTLAALFRVPVAPRHALVLRHMGGLGTEQVAAVDEVDRGTVEERLAQGVFAFVNGWDAGSYDTAGTTTISTVATDAGVAQRLEHLQGVIAALVDVPPTQSVFSRARAHRFATVGSMLAIGAAVVAAVVPALTPAVGPDREPGPPATPDSRPGAVVAAPTGPSVRTDPRTRPPGPAVAGPATGIVGDPERLAAALSLPAGPTPGASRGVLPPAGPGPGLAPSGTGVARAGGSGGAPAPSARPPAGSGGAAGGPSGGSTAAPPDEGATSSRPPAERPRAPRHRPRGDDGPGRHGDPDRRSDRGTGGAGVHPGPGGGGGHSGGAAGGGATEGGAAGDGGAGGGAAEGGGAGDGGAGDSGDSGAGG